MNRAYWITRQKRSAYKRQRNKFVITTIVVVIIVGMLAYVGGLITPL